MDPTFKYEMNFELIVREILAELKIASQYHFSAVQYRFSISVLTKTSQNIPDHMIHFQLIIFTKKIS